MKNVHVLPTDKRSILSDCENYKHVYITSDEEIKEGDWCLIDHNVGQSNGYSILKCLKADVQNGEYLFQDKDGDKFITGRCKKIILTTDQDLIKDGVQAISDEFLEWFVKNPTCEEVDVENEEYIVQYLFKPQEYKFRYKIIIPTDEPKQELPQLGTKEFNDLASACFEGKPKQETIEEAAERESEIRYPVLTHKNPENSPYTGTKKAFKHGVRFGAKWQAEKDKNKYSEEEIEKILHDYRNTFEMYRNIQVLPIMFYQWFEQFKKQKS
jgi:hypothetical protein